MMDRGSVFTFGNLFYKDWMEGCGYIRERKVFGWDLGKDISVPFLV
jgi:hypothetical protein